MDALRLPKEWVSRLLRYAAERDATSVEGEAVAAQQRAIESKLRRLKDLYVEGDLEKQDYRTQRTALERQLEELKGIQGGRRNLLEQTLNQAATVGRLLEFGQPTQQKNVLGRMFKRIEVDHKGRIESLDPRRWIDPLFDVLSEDYPVRDEKDPAFAGPDSRCCN